MDADEDIESLRRRAESGDASAQCDLATQLEWGRLVPRDFTAALHWYEEALKNRCPGWEMAALQIALYYRDGIGTAQDWSRSLEMFEIAARRYGYSYYDVAWAYYWGLGTPRDQAKAFEWNEKMWKGYEHGDAAVALAAQFANGAGVDRDPVQCLRWLRLAGFVDGRLLLGHAVLEGLGGEPPNPDEAAGIFESVQARLPADSLPVAEVAARYWKSWLAAWSDDVKAQFAMANFDTWLWGATGHRSHARMRWLRKAADSGHAAAQYALGELFMYKGTGAIVAPEVGLQWKRRAAAQGHAEAIRDLEAKAKRS